jgi:cytochrome P450
LLGKVRNDHSGVMLAQCIKETLRMYAPVPVMIQRYVVDPEELECTKARCFVRRLGLRANDEVVVMPILIQNHPELWNDPDTYNPDRFATEEAEISREDATKITKKVLGDGPDTPHRCREKLASLQRDMLKTRSGIQERPATEHHDPSKKARFFPFGMGAHTCLGKSYALWITFLVVKTLIDNFDVEVKDPERLFAMPHSFQRIRPHIYSFPKHPMVAHITSRSGSPMFTSEMAGNERTTS